MDFKKHSAIEGKHAILSPSSYHWINYTDEKLESRYRTLSAAAKGTALHDLAHSAITLRVKLSKAEPTLSMYVNDAIGYNMTPEQALYYSDNCFGHADTLSFRRGTLRIHDLKTGRLPGSFHQLEIYAAIFCLEYGIDPHSIKMEFRIYQNRKVDTMIGDPDQILSLMDKIVYFDMKLEMLKEGDE